MEEFNLDNDDIIARNWMILLNTLFAGDKTFYKVESMNDDDFESWQKAGLNERKLLLPFQVSSKPITSLKDLKEEIIKEIDSIKENPLALGGDDDFIRKFSQIYTPIGDKFDYKETNQKLKLVSGLIPQTYHPIIQKNFEEIKDKVAGTEAAGFKNFIDGIDLGNIGIEKQKGKKIPEKLNSYIKSISDYNSFLEKLGKEYMTEAEVVEIVNKLEGYDTLKTQVKSATEKANSNKMKFAKTANLLKNMKDITLRDQLVKSLK